MNSEVWTVTLVERQNKSVEVENSIICLNLTLKTPHLILSALTDHSLAKAFEDKIRDILWENLTLCSVYHARSGNECVKMNRSVVNLSNFCLLFCVLQLWKQRGSLEFSPP